MDIGTAKPSPAEQATVPHHLLDVADPDEEYTVARWQRDARAALADIEGRGRRAAARRRDRPLPAGPRRRPRDPRAVARGARRARGRGRRRRRRGPPRPPRSPRPGRRRPGWSRRTPAGSSGPSRSPWAAGARSARSGPASAPARRRRSSRSAWQVDPGRAGRSASRPGTTRQLDAGFLDEVRALAARPAGLSRTAAQALGYKELLAHVAGRAGLADAVDLAIRRTRQFARRQRAWFRRDPRITWRTPEDAAEHLFARRPARRRLTPRMRLTKHHGLGNDFLVSADPCGDPDPALARAVCDRHAGDRRRRPAAPRSGARSATADVCDGAAERRRQPGRDERQRHRVPRAGGGARPAGRSGPVGRRRHRRRAARRGDPAGQRAGAHVVTVGMGKAEVGRRRARVGRRRLLRRHPRRRGQPAPRAPRSPTLVRLADREWVRRCRPEGQRRASPAGSTSRSSRPARRRRAASWTSTSGASGSPRPAAPARSPPPPRPGGGTSSTTTSWCSMTGGPAGVALGGHEARSSRRSPTSPRSIPWP